MLCLATHSSFIGLSPARRSCGRRDRLDRKFAILVFPPPGGELSARPRQSRLERSQRTVQRRRRLLVIKLLQVHQGQCRAMFRAQGRDNRLHRPLNLAALGQHVRAARFIGHRTVHVAVLGLHVLIERRSLDLRSAPAPPQLIDAGVHRYAVEPVRKLASPWNWNWRSARSARRKISWVRSAASSAPHAIHDTVDAVVIPLREHSEGLGVPLLRRSHQRLVGPVVRGLIGASDSHSEILTIE